jgi:hypothetical protein
MVQRALRKGALVVGTFTLLCMLSGRASADLTTNGGFDSGSFSGWTTSGWTFAASSVQGTGSNWYNSQAGSDYALLGTTLGLTDSLSQKIATTSGQSYTFSFYLANNGSSSNEFQASWNGSTIFDQSIAETGKSYNLYSFTEKATSSLTTIQFSFNDTLSYLALDSVSVVSNAVAAPEPSTAIVALVGGLAMTGYVWQFRRRARAAA